MLDAGGSLVAVVPARGYRAALPAAHRPVFDALLARAARVIALDHEDPTDEAYMDGGLRVLDESDVLVAVWDGQPARGLGGTAAGRGRRGGAPPPRHGDLARRAAR